MFAYLSQSASDAGGFAIVTDRFVCLLGSSSTAAQASELYVALDSDSVHVDDVLAAIVARYSLKDFAIVEVLDALTRRMTVAVQGEVVADVDGATGTRLSGPTGATWMMGEVKGVTAISLSLAGVTSQTEEERLPLRRGVARAAAVALNDTETPVPVFFDEQSPKTVQIDLPTGAETNTEITDEAEAKAHASPTVGREQASAAPTSQAPQPHASQSIPGPTRAAARLDRGAQRIDLSAEVSDARLGVQLSEGKPFAANVPLVFGRRPWSTELDTSSIVSVALVSPKREISAIHLEISEAGGRLRARDLNSTNGTVVMSPGRPSWLLKKGRDTVLGNGDVLDLGEGTFVRIVALDNSV